MAKSAMWTAMMLIITAPGALFAATFNVSDEVGLFAAITTANSNGEDDTINVAAGTITLTADLPDIVDDSGFSLSILGAGQSTTIIEAGDLPQELGGTGTHNRRVFNMDTGSNVLLQDMTVRRGRISDLLGIGGNIQSNGDLNVEDCLIEDGVCLGGPFKGGGAGIYSGAGSLDVTNSTIQNHLVRAVSFGGAAGIEVGITGIPVTITNCTISNNVTEHDGTGIVDFIRGGGVAIVGDLTTAAVISGTTFMNNVARDTSGIDVVDARGGGLYLSTDMECTVVNCTFSGNEAKMGAGLWVTYYSTETNYSNMDGCTITGNTATVSGGGLYSGKTEIRNSIIAGNTSPSAPDIYNFANTFLLGHNLIGNKAAEVFNSTEPSDQIGTSATPIDPMLGPLADNGGATLTHALLTGSPAIGAGTDVAIDSSTILTDQRGYTRTFNGTADIGAYEFGAGPPDTTAPTASFSAVSSPRNTDFGTVTITFDEDVQNVDITDFALTRDLSTVNISGLSVSTVAADEYTIDLSTVTGTEGAYFFGFSGASNDIEDLAGNDVTGTPSIIALVDTTAPTSEAEIASVFKVEGAMSGTYTASDNVGGSGLDEVDLYVKEPAGSWTLDGVVTGGTWSYAPSAGDGEYLFATVASDLAGNSEAVPTGSDAGDLAVLFNDVENSSFAYASIADGSYTFPMTDTLHVVITFSGGASGGPITVSRTVGDVAPVGLAAAKLIDEALAISGTFSGTASIEWNYDGANDDSLSGSLTTVFQFDGGSQTGQYSVTPAGTVITIPGVTSFSDWYAGDNSATTNEWTILD